MKLLDRLEVAIAKLSPKIYFSLAYLHNRGKIPNLRDPKDYSEILIKRVLDGKVNQLYYLADKYKVREYIVSKGYADILIPLHGAYNSPDEIDFSALPQKFAMKMNFGAGMNIICTDKSTIDHDKVRAQLNNWLNRQTFSHSERHYDLISRKIIVEEFVDDGNGGFPTDYKFTCIHGKVACILACSGRESGHGNFFMYSTSWDPLYEYSKNKEVCLIPKPANLEDMIKIAEKLSKNIDTIRVDLYSNGSKIWFGELTLTSSGCILHRWTQKALDDLGNIYRNNNS